MLAHSLKLCPLVVVLKERGLYVCWNNFWNHLFIVLKIHLILVVGVGVEVRICILEFSQWFVICNSQSNNTTVLHRKVFLMLVKDFLDKIQITCNEKVKRSFSSPKSSDAITADPWTMGLICTGSLIWEIFSINMYYMYYTICGQLNLQMQKCRCGRWL